MKTAAGAWVLVVLGCAAGCCQTVPAPHDQWAATQVDLGRAEAGGAASIPEAKLHLHLAQEDLEEARRLMGTDNGRATTLIAVARAEAQLATSLARQAQANEGARQAAAELERAKQGP